MIIDKGKQKEGIVYNEEFFLYKPYAILLEPSRPLTPELILLKEEVNNPKKTLKTLQSSIKTISFLPLAYYKFTHPDRKKNIQYWNEITAEFIKQKHNMSKLKTIESIYFHLFLLFYFFHFLFLILNLRLGLA